MPFNVSVRPRARRQIRDAYVTLELARAGLGERFNREFDAIVERLADNPLQFPAFDESGARRAIVGNFKYLLFFDVRRGTVRVLALLHGHRDLSDWRDLH